MLIHNMSEYKTGLGNSYRCVKLQRISLASNMKNLTGVLEVTELQFQAFRTEKTKIFGLGKLRSFLFIYIHYYNLLL